MFYEDDMEATALIDRLVLLTVLTEAADDQQAKMEAALEAGIQRYLGKRYGFFGRKIHTRETAHKEFLEGYHNWDWDRHRRILNRLRQLHEAFHSDKLESLVTLPERDLLLLKAYI